MFKFPPGVDELYVGQVVRLSLAAMSGDAVEFPFGSRKDTKLSLSRWCLSVSRYVGRYSKRLPVCDHLLTEQSEWRGCISLRISTKDERHFRSVVNYLPNIHQGVAY